ncbi:hypothetical protein C8Q79DRAFT_897407 [Trametes meyenii]|nr:hypothetical protein C8Q79DRAFT_897407 [Trametes meyenii]
MSNNYVKLGDDSVRVLKLELGGSNWVLYKDRLLWAADAKGYRKHLDGTASEPDAPQTTTDTAARTATPGLAEWRKGEANVKQLIASTIPDSLFMKICVKPNARAIWEALAQEFECKSHMVLVDLQRRLQDQ